MIVDVSKYQDFIEEQGLQYLSLAGYVMAIRDLEQAS